MFSRVLIANRGLIQANCVRAVKELGAEAVTVYAADDRDSVGVRTADRSILLEGSSAARPYADIDQIVHLAKDLGVDAVHPGYGFLGQNTEFIRRLEAEGITPIAPRCDPAFQLTDKPAIRAEAEAAGLAVLPGTGPQPAPEALRAAAEAAGYPLMVKPCHGFGGHGLHVVRRPADLDSAFRQSLAVCAKFGMNSVEVFAERYLPNAHHVEFPVLVDNAGTTVIFPEVECTIQRRFQKILVETPSPTLAPALRDRLADWVKTLVARLRVRGFASVEFLVDRGQAWFLEINGYIQPSHTATSMHTGIDVLRGQIQVYAGDPIPFSPAQIGTTGHVIGIYLSAEDPEAGFAPSPGLIQRLRMPFGEGLLAQSALSSGDTVGAFYDPRIAKVLVRDFTRDLAIRKMRVALEGSVIEGIRTNLPLMLGLFQSAEFAANRVDVSYLSKESNQQTLIEAARGPAGERAAALIAAIAFHRDQRNAGVRESAVRRPGGSVWSSAARWFGRRQP
jgi:acetyl/propionyl-CoA carboxylase alpha subunit